MKDTFSTGCGCVSIESSKGYQSYRSIFLPAWLGLAKNRILIAASPFEKVEAESKSKSEAKRSPKITSADRIWGEEEGKMYGKGHKEFLLLLALCILVTRLRPLLFQGKILLFYIVC